MGGSVQFNDGIKILLGELRVINTKLLAEPRSF